MRARCSRKSLLTLGAPTLALRREAPLNATRHNSRARFGNFAPERLSVVGMSLSYSGAMAALLACPFCRKLYASGEASSCPECDVRLVAMSQLPTSLDALEDEAEQGQLTLPENLPLPPTYMGRGRGLLLALSALGLFAFFLPWVELTAPESVVYSAFDLARGRAGFLWGGVAA